MPNIIDTSYFVGDIEIPNLNQPENAAEVTRSIVTYEKEVLIALLGYTLYKELLANIASPAGKWVGLIDGEEFSFTLNGQTVNTKWEGLKGENKKSLIAYYVYFSHRQKKASYNTDVGIEVEGSTENSVTTSLAEKLIPIWNEFVKMYGGEFTEDEWIVANYPVDEECLSSAYNYLLAKKTDFPTWKFTTQGGEINRFGI